MYVVAKSIYLTENLYMHNILTIWTLFDHIYVNLDGQLHALLNNENYKSHEWPNVTPNKTVRIEAELVFGRQ